MRLRFLTVLTGLLVMGGLAAPPAAAQPKKATPKTIVVPAPNVPGGKVVLVHPAHLDQLRVGPGTKTVRLHPALRAAVNDKTIPIPAAWDWTRKDGKLVVLAMYGNNAYGDCYYATLVKLFILYQWQIQNTQLTFDLQSVINRYLRLSGGDNGLSDSDVFPEIKNGVVGPSGPHKALDVLIVPPNDVAAQKLTGFLFGPHMLTFEVRQNFMNGVVAGAKFTGSSGALLGGHAIPLSGRTADDFWQGETWAIQPSFLGSDTWIKSVNGEIITVFSKEWFNKDGYAPNGQHYTTLAALWNSMGGHVTDLTGGFPAPTPTPTPPIPVPPTPTPSTTAYVGPDQRVNFNYYNPKTGEIIGTSFIEKNSFVLHPVAAAAPTLSLDVIFALFALDRDIRASGNGTLDADFKAMMAAIKARKNILPAVEKFAFDLIAAGTDPAVLADLRRLMTDLGIPIPFGSVLHTFPNAKPSAPDSPPRSFPKAMPAGAALPRGVVPAFALAV